MYKVELIQVKKSYVSVTVDADNRHEALARAKSLFEEGPDQKETTEQFEFKVQKDWNFWDFFFNKS